MTAFDITLDRLPTTRTSSLKDALPVDVRDFVTGTLKGMGFNSVVIDDETPSAGNRTSLWYDKDNKALKRYNPLTGLWTALVADQFALHILQRVFGAASQDVDIAADDLIPFFDSSLNETRTINFANLKLLSGIGPGWQLLSTSSVSGSVSSFDVPIPTMDYNDLHIIGTGITTTAVVKNDSIVRIEFLGAGDVSLGEDNFARKNISSAGEPHSAYRQVAGNKQSQTGVLWVTSENGGNFDRYPGPIALAALDLVKFRFKARESATAKNLTAGTFKLYAR